MTEYRWRLREMMRQRGMAQTSDLYRKLTERGVTLSRQQVFRLATQAPKRLSLLTLATMCAVLACTPADLIVCVPEETPPTKIPLPPVFSLGEGT
jgi:DNA-binding Xre family transcriptional regulator